MERREYLWAAAAVAATVAGCSESADNGTTEPGEIDDSLPAWSKWIPADTFPDPQAEVVVVDIQQANDQFPPDVYAEFGFPEIATVYGVSESDFEYLIGLSQGGGDELNAVTGSYEPASIIDHLGVADENIETVRGYQVLDGELAIGESAIIIGSSYETMIDARAGDVPTLGTTDDDWQELLEAVSDGTLVGIEDGNGLADDGQSFLEADVERSAIEIDSAGGERAQLTARLMFDSETSAADALEGERQGIVDEATGEDGSLERIDQEGKQIVVVVETETFDF